MSVIVGIDIGSTNIKVGAFRLDGISLSVHKEENELAYPYTNWSEYDPDKLWKTVVRCLRKTLSAVDSATEIAGVSICSMGEVGIPIDQSGNPLYAAISWMDQRAVEQSTWWGETIGRDRILEITGMPLDPMYAINRILWIRENRPDVFRSMDKWLSIPDYIAFKLTGKMGTDYSIAARTMAFDIRRKEWSAELCEACGIDPAIFPEPSNSGTIVGEVIPQASMVASIPVGTPVVLGGHDHACVALSLGITNTGQIVDSTGTGEGIVSVSETANLPPAIAATNRYSCYPHCVPDKYIVLGHLGVVGGMIEWILKLTNEGGELDEFTPSPDFPLYFPHLNATKSTVWDSGIWMGLTPSCSPRDLVYSVMEGMCLWFRQSVDLHVQGFQSRSLSILLTGGLTRFPFLTQMKTEVLDSPIEVPVSPDLAVLGAAIVAGVGSEAYRSWDDALSVVRVETQRYVQHPDRVDLHQSRYERYRTLAKALEVSIGT